MLQILNLLEANTPHAISDDNSRRRIALLNAMRLGHATRMNDPVPNFYDYNDNISIKLSKTKAQKMIEQYKSAGASY